MLIHDTRGRSRVLGVIQLVGLVILLSAVLGMGIHGTVDGLAGTVPSTSFDFDYDEADETLVITHTDGDPVDASVLRVVGVDGECTADDWGSQYITAGDSCTLENVDSGAQIRLAWDGLGTNTATLDGWAGPDV